MKRSLPFTCPLLALNFPFLRRTKPTTLMLRLPVPTKRKLTAIERFAYLSKSERKHKLNLIFEDKEKTDTYREKDALFDRSIYFVISMCLHRE